jgi:hypothetical protein
VADKLGHQSTLTCTYRVDEQPAPTPEPMATPTPEPTATPTPEPMATPTPEPIASPALSPTPASATKPTATPWAPRPAEPTPGVEPTATPTPAPEQELEPTIKLKPRGRKPVTADGRLRLSVSCSGADCEGVMAISGTATATSALRGRSAAFRVAAGTRGTAALRLTRRERRAYARRGRLVVRVKVRLADATRPREHRVVVRATHSSDGGTS